MKRVLLIDESTTVQDEMRNSIGTRFSLTAARSLGEARGLLSMDLFDVILLETTHPDGDGYAFCAEVRGKQMTQGTPILFLSDKATLSDKVKAFSQGADDYMVKPCEPLEVEARIEARLKNRTGYGEKEEGEGLLKGNLTLSVPYQKAVLHESGVDKDLKLTPTEFRLLYYFIKNEGTVLSRDQLLSTIWNDDVHVLTRTIDKHISTLKKKLGSHANYIQSVHSRGYRFSVSRTGERVQPVSPEATA